MYLIFYAQFTGVPCLFGRVLVQCARRFKTPSLVDCNFCPYCMEHYDKDHMFFCMLIMIELKFNKHIWNTRETYERQKSDVKTKQKELQNMEESLTHKVTITMIISFLKIPSNFSKLTIHKGFLLVKGHDDYLQHYKIIKMYVRTEGWVVTYRSFIYGCLSKSVNWELWTRKGWWVIVY